MAKRDRRIKLYEILPIAQGLVVHPYVLEFTFPFNTYGVRKNSRRFCLFHLSSEDEVGWRPDERLPRRRAPKGAPIR